MKALAWVLVCCVGVVGGGRVLFCQVVGTASHRTLAMPLLSALAARNHSVTAITRFPPAHPRHHNLHQIQHEFPELDEEHNQFEMSGLVGETLKYRDLLPRVARRAYTTPWFSQLWRERHQVDLLIVDGAFNDFCLAFLHDTQTPLAYLDTTGVVVPHHATLGLVHNPATVAYPVTPCTLAGLLGRLVNAFFYCTGIPVWRFLVVRPTYNAISEVIPNLPSFPELERRHLSLVLSNSHHALDGPTPLLPNTLEVACIHCRAPAPLPQDIEEFLQERGTPDVIYVSLGSHVRSSNIPDVVLGDMLKVMEKLPYSVLWKFDKEPGQFEPHNFPPNVMVRKWFPQQDVLGDKRVKVFVSHGGLLSVHEAKYHGTPMVVLPLYGDQPKNARQVMEDGLGRHLPWADVTEESFREAILDVASNDHYTRRIQHISKLFREETESGVGGVVRAVWWLEYLMRHGGVPHLTHSHASRLSWPQTLLVDVALVVGVVVVLLVVGVNKVLKCIRRKRHLKID